MRALRSLAALFALAAGPALSSAVPVDPPSPPATRTEDVVETLHGHAVPDPYRWLEDQGSPETRAWIDAQNAYTSSVVSSMPGRERLARRLGELIRVDAVTVPVARGRRYFYSRRAAEEEQALLYVKAQDRREEVLVDPRALGGGPTRSVQLLDVSAGGRLVAYAVRDGGEDEIGVDLMEVDGRAVKERLDKARYSGLALAPDGRTVFFSRRTKGGPRVYRQLIGSGMPEEIFGQGYGPEKIIGASLSGDGRYLVVTVRHGSAARKTEVYVQDVAAGTPLRPIVNDLEAVFSGGVGGDTLFLRTNWKAPGFRVMAVDLRDPARERWREVIPAGPATITDLDLAGGRLFVTRLEDVRPRIEAYTADGRRTGEVPLPGFGTPGTVTGEWGGDEAFFQFSSFAQPPTIYRHRVAEGVTEVWARQPVPFDGEAVEVRQVFYPSRDGTRVPMFVAHRRGLRQDGRSPTLLTAYGGFNLAQMPSFSARAAAWIENGGVYALANLRGGGEYGEDWHRAGMLEKKQNVFDDFIAAAEWLVSHRYTSPDRLAISGNSNGGLLVGAAFTQRPELFRAVVCGYPLLDMVRYHRFMVAGYWVPEYGSAEDPAQFGVLRAYSPYHNVARGVRYPAVLFVTGDGDTRVAPLHARKMAARMQAATASGAERPVLLHYDTKAGHSRAGLIVPATKQVEDLTRELQFLFSQLGGVPAASGRR
ncbi:MAG TPA: prolyl oligopeptidase family serine peptidase [Vicinamibacteria bacterium]|nr:prolyl oligopeptidase family serine peptidase [Vicinamibacteria bacterium]